MKRIARTGLGGCAILLCGLIALEASEFRAPLPDTSRQSSPVALITVQNRSKSVSGVAAAQLSAILARPLFSPNRAAPASVDAPSSVNQIPRLAGIVVGPAGSFAVFAPVHGEPLMIATGQSIGPYTVRSIGPGGVTISDPSGARILHIAFANSGPEDSGAAAAPPPSAPFAGLMALPGLPGWMSPAVPEDLPNAATWSGPPALSRLPIAQGQPASRPLITSGSNTP